MSVFFQILMLLVQLFPEALKAIKAWQDYHGQQLTAANRARLAADVKTAVQAAVTNKNTAGLEAVIKSLGKPEITAANPDPKSPS